MDDDRSCAVVVEFGFLSDPGCSRRVLFRTYFPEIIYLFDILFRAAVAAKQFSCATKPFSISTQNSGNRRWLPIGQQKRRTAPAEKTGDSQMRTLSFLLTFAFVLTGPTLAGSPDGSLPGFGSFTHNGSPIVTTAPSIVVAAR